MGIFGNSVPVAGCNPHCSPSDATCLTNAEACLFDNRPHASTAKAVMISTASQYTFDTMDHDLTRTHQGWGLINAGRLYLLRRQFAILINETVLLDLDPGTGNSECYEATVNVPASTFAVRVTLVYTDFKGSSSSATRDAVNDLDLKVTAPDGTTVYWGNCGLREGNWSSSACIEADHPLVSDRSTIVVDTVENVFVSAPTSGSWTVRVEADEINKDGHRETTPWDVDLALVVSIDPDCDGNSASDADDILTGVSADCDSNGVPDDCDPDCNGNGIPDDCELTVPKGACCLFNPDRCERRTQCSCTALGGIYVGDGTRCTPMQCLQYGPQPGPGVGQVP